jgi:hypothetical protein
MSMFVNSGQHYAIYEERTTVNVEVNRGMTARETATTANVGMATINTGNDIGRRGDGYREKWGLTTTEEFWLNPTGDRELGTTA